MKARPGALRLFHAHGCRFSTADVKALARCPRLRKVWYLDFRADNKLEWADHKGSMWSGRVYMYPGQAYSPLAVFGEKDSYTVGVSISYPMAEYAHDVGVQLSAPGGKYTATVKPMMTTAYTTKSTSITSAVVSVRVRPRLRLVRVASHRYLLRVFATRSFAGKYASFQRYNATGVARTDRPRCPWTRTLRRACRTR